jgi:ribosomal protein L13E
MGMHVEIRDSNTHQQLQDDLIEYLWRLSHQIC